MTLPKSPSGCDWISEGMATWRLTIEYDGAAFCGWQAQPEVETVQVTLEKALRQFFGGETIHCMASGRTDSGVHALGQVVSFRAQTERTPEKLRLALYTLLPPTIACRKAEIVADTFNARMTAIGKRYRYVILNRQDRSPFWWTRSLLVRKPLRWDAIEQGLRDMLGTYDCSAFRGPGCEERNPLRSIREAIHIDRGDDLHWIEFEGPGFLRYQIRIMVGTLLEIGEGRRPADDIPRIIATRDRKQAGKTALADGLYLVRVDYPY